MNFLYTIDPNVDEPIMLIDGHIGFDEIDGPGVMGAQFVRELMFLDNQNKSRIQIWINSPGGIILDGEMIYFAMLKSKTKVDTYNMGTCASIAGPLHQAGRKRYAMDYSKFMFHNPYSDEGSEDEALKSFKQTIVTMICKRSGISEEQMSEIMNRTTWMMAEEAEKLGLVDEIEMSEDFNKPRITKEADVKAQWKEYSKILNKIIDTKKPQKMDLSKITNKLGLVPEANVDSIFNAIESLAIKNKAEMDECTNKMNDAIKKFSDMEKKYNDVSAEFENAKKELEDAKALTDADAAKAKAARAEDMINKAATTGKIKNEVEVVKTWKARFISDEAGTTELLKTMGVNATAPVLEDIKNELVVDANSSEAAKFAASIEAKTGFKYGSAEYMNHVKIGQMRGHYKK